MKAAELRKSILQLAIQGKLAEQIPTDEPASVLLERIRAEKQQLIKAGKIKKDKAESVIYRSDDGFFYERIGKEVRCIDGEIPFEIPGTWEWVKFSSIVDFSLGKTPERNNPSYWGDDYRWVSIADMQDKSVLLNTKEGISTLAYKSKFNNSISPAGTLIMSFKLTIGKVSILGIEAAHNEAIISIFPYFDDNQSFKYFLFHFLSIFTGYTASTDAIKGATLNSSKIREMLIPLPPVAEQERIVARLNELEPMLAEYERLELQESALEKSFPEDLNKAILQYAIQGKLVAQDPADEPASVLLERIRAEKQQLIKAGKIKKDKTESHIYRGEDGSFYERIGKEVRCIDEEIPFEIPNSWEWVRLGQFTSSTSGGTPERGNPKFWSGNISWLKSGELTDGIITNQSEEKITDEGLNGSSAKIFPKGTLLIALYGATAGKLGVLSFDSATNQAVCGFFENDYYETKYLFFYFKAVKEAIIKDSWGQAQPNISQTYLKNLLFPLPPLAEQVRIVAKLEEIKSLIQ